MHSQLGFGLLLLNLDFFFPFFPQTRTLCYTPYQSVGGCEIWYWHIRSCSLLFCFRYYVYTTQPLCECTTETIDNERRVFHFVRRNESFACALSKSAVFFPWSFQNCPDCSAPLHISRRTYWGCCIRGITVTIGPSIESARTVSTTGQKTVHSKKQLYYLKFWDAAILCIFVVSVPEVKKFGFISNKWADFFSATKPNPTHVTNSFKLKLYMNIKL